MKQERYFTPITHLLPKSKWQLLLLALAIGVMSFYSIYTTLFDGLGLDHYYRHQSWFRGDTMFFNPWQYRVLAPFLLEGVYYLLDFSLFKIIPIEVIASKLSVMNVDGKDEITKTLIKYCSDAKYLKYLITFIAVRLSLNALVFVLMLYYFKSFTQNIPLIYFSVFFFSLCLGNSVNDCDFSFNTIIDVIIYLLAGLLIVKQWNPLWLIVITILGSFNRETSILIPGLYFLNQLDYKEISLRNIKIDYLKKPIFLTAISYVTFFAIFIGIRLYYGYVPHEDWRVPAGWPMFKLNVMSMSSVKSYFEMYGTFMLLPFIIFIQTKSYSKYLLVMYLAVVPLWIFMHLWMVVAYQSRLFLVPTALILFPMAIELINRNFADRKLNLE